MYYIIIFSIYPDFTIIILFGIMGLLLYGMEETEMKLFANFFPIMKIIGTLKPIKQNFRDMQAARDLGDNELERERILETTSYWGADIMNRLGSDIHVYGEENIPDEGPVVLMGNHQGYADIFTYCAVFTKFQFGFVAKRELAELPFFGDKIKAIRSVFINRDTARSSMEAINDGIKLIEQGFSLAIFPEGTRSKGGEPKPFMKGSVKLATKPGVPIVPVSIEGTYKMLEQDGYFHGDDIYIKIHPPIPTAGISRKEEKELIPNIEKTVMDGVEELKKLSQSY